MRSDVYSQKRKAPLQVTVLASLYSHWWCYRPDYKHTSVRTHAHTHARIHARTHAHTHAHMHARIHTRTHARTEFGMSLYNVVVSITYWYLSTTLGFYTRRFYLLVDVVHWESGYNINNIGSCCTLLHCQLVNFKHKRINGIHPVQNFA